MDPGCAFLVKLMPRPGAQHYWKPNSDSHIPALRDYLAPVIAR